MSKRPSPNGANGGSPRKAAPPMSSSSASTPTPAGRGPKGRFTQGNTCGTGNPFAKAVAQLRSSLIAAVTTEDIKAIVAALIREAKAGNIAAAKEVLDRCLGKSVEADLIARLDELEAAVAKQQEIPP